MIVLLFLAALAVYARAEMEYHPQAILHYLEMEDREMARKVRSLVNVRGFPSGKPSFRPSGSPTGIPINVVSTQHNYLSKQEEMPSIPGNTMHSYIFKNLAF